MARKKSWLQIRVEYGVAAAVLVALRRLPLRVAEKLSHLAACTLDLVVPKLRRVANVNLSFAFPALDAQARDQIIDGVFRSIARLLLAFSRFPDINSVNVSQWIEYEGIENYHAAKLNGRGVLVATAHLGNWELSAFAHGLLTEPMHVMVRPLDNPLIDRLVENRRTLSGNRLIYKWEAARAVIRALKASEAVGILIDQNTSESEGAFVEFFGQICCAATAFVKFAHHSGATIIPGFALWEEKKRKYILRFYPAVEMSGDTQADTQRIQSVIEDTVRQYPDQWMWIHRRWKTRPQGEKSLY